MELVLGTVVLSQAGTWVLDKVLDKHEEQISDGGTDSSAAPSTAPAPAGSTAARVQELEKELAALKAAARDASGPDNFIQYARITRKQKKVEEELTSLKGDEQPTLPILELMNSIMPRKNIASSAKHRVLRSLLSFLPLLLLSAWFQFGSNSGPGTIITVECDIFRPLSWMLTKVPVQPNCSAASDTCDLRQMCAIGFRPITFLANSVLARILSVLRKASL